MIKVSLDLDTDVGYGYKWFSCNGVYVKGYLWSEEGLLYKDKALLSYFEDSGTIDVFSRKVKTASGLFSVIIHRNNVLYAAVDMIRTFPLFYSYSRDNFHITDNPDNLCSERRVTFNERAVLQFKSIGYVLGRNTLLNGIHQICAGEYVVFEKPQLNRFFYVSSPMFLPEQIDRVSMKRRFRDMLSSLSKRMVDILDGRPVALPLSGGYDSRLLLCLLKKEGYRNVLCFTYGAKDSPERTNAERTAKILGYKWIFIDYSEYIGENITASLTFRKWIDFTANYSSFFYFQEYLAAYHLKKKGIVPEDTVFIPGHTADVIAGGHLSPDVKEIRTVNELTSYTFLKNVNLRKLNRKERKLLKTDISESLIYNTVSDKFDYTLYEAWEQRERQAKQIVNSAKIWDFFGFQYILPFWDTVFVSFFAGLPFSYKSNKNFYDEVVKEIFAEEEVLFGQELSPTVFAQWKQRMKFVLSKYGIDFSFLTRKKLWLFDTVYFKIFSKEMLADLKKSNELKKIVLYNGILSSWYVRYVQNRSKTTWNGLDK